MKESYLINKNLSKTNNDDIFSLLSDIESKILSIKVNSQALKKSKVKAIQKIQILMKQGDMSVPISKINASKSILYINTLHGNSTDSNTIEYNDYLAYYLYDESVRIETVQYGRDFFANIQIIEFY